MSSGQSGLSKAWLKEERKGEVEMEEEEEEMEEEEKMEATVVVKGRNKRRRWGDREKREEVR